MADEDKKTAAPQQSVRRSQRGEASTGSSAPTRRVTTEGDVQEAIAPLRQARMETERQKEIDAQKRTTSDPMEAKHVDPAEAERFEEAVQTQTGSQPLPQRKVPTDNSLPNSDDQYVVPNDEEIEEIEEAADPYTSDVALKSAKRRQAETDKAEKREATKKYVVQGGSIFPKSGGKAKVGETVELTSEEARSYNRMGRLAPYLGDED